MEENSSDQPRNRSGRDWLKRKKAAEYLESLGCPISPRTLEKWASNNNSGKGPAFTRIRWNIVRYHRKDLESWAAREAVRVE